MLHAIGQLEHQPAERRPRNQAAGHRQQERWRNRSDRKAVGSHGTNREPIDQERAGIIQQALAFEDGQDPMRRSHLAEHGRCRCGVRWCDDGAECKRRSPRHRRNQRARDHGDRDRRQGDGKDNQAGDRSPVVPEISRRGVVCRIEQYGCDEECQRELGRYGERRCARKKREEGTADRQEDRIRGADPTCQSGQDHCREDQTQQPFELTHVAMITAFLTEGKVSLLDKPASIAASSRLSIRPQIHPERPRQ